MNRHFLAIALTVAPVIHAETSSPAGVEILRTPGGVRFGIWPGKPAKPAPIIFALGSTIEGVLGSSYFRQCGQFLAEKGYFTVSIDLPCHGGDVRQGEGSGLSGWKTRVGKGEDFVADITGKLREVLDCLIAEKLADPEKIAALGTSRGGFIALHFAAVDPRVKCAMGFSPVSDLAALSEFRGAEEHPLVKKLSLVNQAAALAGRSIWIVIGDRDERVGTDKAVQLARSLTAASLEKNISPKVDLHVIAEPRGHTVPAGYAKLGADWLEAQFSGKPNGK
jgi:dienelactone hydrolase